MTLWVHNSLFAQRNVRVTQSEANDAMNGQAIFPSR